MKQPMTALAALVVLLLLTSAALAQGGYSLTRWTLAGGGHTFSQAGGYVLGGTIGQPEAGATSGGGYSLVGGFWAGLAEQPEPNSYLYLPLVLR